jgi:membrane protease YdiL (CAAX protease family)
MKTIKYKLKDHPWMALVVVLFSFVFLLDACSIILFEILQLNPQDRINQILPSTISNLLLIVIITPLLFKLPCGSSNLKRYFDDIGLLRITPFFKLIAIGVSCYLIFLLNQALGTVIYGLSQDESINLHFLGEIFKFSNEFPPKSNGWLISLPSILEEFIFRGIILVVFLNKYSSIKAILYSAISFGFIHLLNLANDKEMIWVLGQVIYNAIAGLFYGYLFLRTKSLLPVVLIHYLNNLFIGTVTGYIQSNASAEIQSIYGIVFFFGLIPTTLSIFWIKYFFKKWPIQ